MPDCMKPDGQAKATKQLTKKARKKSSASNDADWVPELEEVSYLLFIYYENLGTKVQVTKLDEKFKKHNKNLTLSKKFVSIF